MRKEEIVHVVVCEEKWEEVSENAQIITQHKKFAWSSSESLNRLNLHQKGMKAFIKFMDETFRLFRLNPEWIRNCLTENYQVRYV